jgi:hypothetical protein
VAFYRHSLASLIEYILSAGCHALALDLVRSWSFDRPSVATHDPMQQIAPASPTTMRRMLAFEPAMRRRSSIMIDMDLSTAPPTRRPSPEPGETGEQPSTLMETINEDGDLIARKAGLGSLLKTAKHHVQVPEFDIDSFF